MSAPCQHRVTVPVRRPRGAVRAALRCLFHRSPIGFAISAEVQWTLTVIECTYIQSVSERLAGKPDPGITRDATTEKQGGMAAEKAAAELARSPAEWPRYSNTGLMNDRS